ncbi:lipoate--protein ligase family protein [Synechococcus elongatus]|uniref:Biotin/lipoate A/B protein ligase family protein n=1 Tax=Synechococcus elongatus PCC 11802 TaxID=2283154 RepID=A0AAT9JRS5_SYNEL|nr:biotin/lipoate A/B protein ligase family protein [Synechococcus elongatus]QFZ92918.1 lipoate--protein ligase family protein [Synechococcus elongatus PCC 11802]
MPLSTRSWQLLPWLIASGDWQMALDDWLLEEVRRDRRPPTFRLFSWPEPTLSLGWHQASFSTNWSCPIVRRPTGGRAVLHGGDLCYSLVTPAPAKRDRSQTYCLLSQFLRQAFQRLEQPLITGSDRPDRTAIDCFARATVADLRLVDGRKCIGSAQLWRDRTILQQGSIQLHPPDCWPQVLGTTPPPVLDLPIATLATTLVSSFADCYGLNLTDGSLTAADWQAVDERRSQFQIHKPPSPLTQ